MARAHDAQYGERRRFRDGDRRGPRLPYLLQRAWRKDRPLPPPARYLWKPKKDKVIRPVSSRLGLRSPARMAK